MQWCGTTRFFSILVNGPPSGFFKRTRGLRWGDPSSPYLFVIVMEALGWMLTQAIADGYLTGYRMGHSGRELSHLLFDDDTLILCKPNEKHVMYLMWNLMRFEA